MFYFFQNKFIFYFHLKFKFYLKIEFFLFKSQISFHDIFKYHYLSPVIFKHTKQRIIYFSNTSYITIYMQTNKQTDNIFLRNPVGFLQPVFLHPQMLVNIVIPILLRGRISRYRRSSTNHSVGRIG